MKQKYQLKKSDDQSKLIIKELSEADPGMYVATCEEKFDIAMLSAAHKEGPDSFRSALRTPNMFLATVYVDQLAEGAAAVLGGEESVEFFFNDIETLAKNKPPEEDAAVKEEAEEVVEIDDLLEDDSEKKPAGDETAPEPADKGKDPEKK